MEPFDQTVDLGGQRLSVERLLGALDRPMGQPNGCQMTILSEPVSRRCLGMIVVVARQPENRNHRPAPQPLQGEG
jgi:hypothetical protein